MCGSTGDKNSQKELVALGKLTLPQPRLSSVLPGAALSGGRAVRNKERVLIKLIGKIFNIDEEGRVWRIARQRRGVLFPLSFKIRAEHNTPPGYLNISCVVNGKQIFCFAHRLVYQYFYGDVPEGLVINHMNGVKDDNHPRNLEAITLAENSERKIFTRRWWSPYSLRVEDRAVRM